MISHWSHEVTKILDSTKQRSQHRYSTYNEVQTRGHTPKAATHRTREGIGQSVSQQHPPPLPSQQQQQQQQQQRQGQRQGQPTNPHHHLHNTNNRGRVNQPTLTTIFTTTPTTSEAGSTNQDLSNRGHNTRP
ncbi:hypothetical protein Pcinc_024114 [Petrolisthes cinctipes]|uniref:Uncharacterized protein n=1 Tax=Petrolisthes cinctipes TaxID=88211 RepID=A0AAE1KDG2_PETCI|nr:hypothetical protein Pcinc_024114 [Petrolisthes cinctipes]